MLILLEVLHKLHAWGARDQAEDIVRPKQCKVDAYQRTSQLEEAEDDIHRHSVRPLVGLGDVHRGNHEWTTHPCSARESALPGRVLKTFITF